VPELTVDQLTLALLGVAALALISLVLAVVLALRLRRLTRQFAMVRGDAEERDIMQALGGSLQRLDLVDRRIDAVAAGQQELEAIGRFSLQKFALVRYDAFADMGGQMSFSAAFLDDHGDGVVITSINGRSETRTYAKQVHRHDSEHNLSGEERAAIEAARSGQERGTSAPSVSRSR
jgi:hypothetical protein